MEGVFRKYIPAVGSCCSGTQHIPVPRRRRPRVTGHCRRRPQVPGHRRRRPRLPSNRCHLEVPVCRRRYRRSHIRVQCLIKRGIVTGNYRTAVSVVYRIITVLPICVVYRIVIVLLYL